MTMRSTGRIENDCWPKKAQLIWFVGLSGSGKSTLASRVEQELHQMGRLTYILDGDNVRSGLNKDLDFSEVSRVENIRRIGEVSKLMVDAGLVVITAFISPFRSDRETIRELVGADRFVEVHVDCPIEECEKRDVKGLYAKARQGLIPISPVSVRLLRRRNNRRCACRPI